MFPRRAMVAVAAGALACFGAGCLFVAAGVAAGGAVVYVEGELRDTLPARLDQAAAATEKALAALELRVDSAGRDGLSGQYIAHLADETRVVIQLHARGDKATKVGIRVGIVGDRPLSERILAAIRENL